MIGIAITNLPIFLSLGGIYIFTLSSMILLAFWSTFSINIFEFIGINDVIKNSLYIVMAIVGIVFFEILYYYVVFIGTGIRISDYLLNPVLSGILYSALTIYFFFVKKDMSLSIRSYQLSCFFSIYLSIIFTYLDPLINVIPEQSIIRYTIYFMSICLPIILSAISKISALKIKEGNGSYIVNLEESKIDITSDNNIAYIGFAGNHYFLFGLNTQSVFILKLKDKDLLVLTKNPALIKKREGKTQKSKGAKEWKDTPSTTDEMGFKECDFKKVTPEVNILIPHQ